MNEGKLNIRATMYLSFGFMAVSLAWSLYNSMVPQILESFGLSAGLIGLVMVFGNFAGNNGLLFIPASEHYRVLFLWSCVAFAVAFVLSFVRHGEDIVAQPEQTSATEVLASMGD